jgi:hypothetical protein
MNLDILKTGIGMTAVCGFIFFILNQSPPMELVEKIAGMGGIAGIVITAIGVMHNG